MKLINIWNNRKKILEGLSNSVFRKEHVEVIAKERMSICNSCEFIDHTGEKCFVPGTQPCCGKCGCKLDWKTRSLSSSCGDEENPKWEALLSEEDEKTVYDKLDIKNE